MKHPYRIAAPVEELSSLEEEALMLAYRLRKTKPKHPKISMGIKDYEEQIVSLLRRAGFKKSYHCHFCPNLWDICCDTYFSRDASIVLMRFLTSNITISHADYRRRCMDSRLYVIPNGKETLDEIKRERPRPWCAELFFNALLEESTERRFYEKKINALQQKALKTTIDSLLYITSEECIDNDNN